MEMFLFDNKYEKSPGGLITNSISVIGRIHFTIMGNFDNTKGKKILKVLVLPLLTSFSDHSIQTLI
jgi:hypothetical protein